MAEENDVHILAWPATQPLQLAHGFDPASECPLKVSFSTPIDVNVNGGGQVLDVNMAMDVSARRPIPMCFSLCEPICARSDYRIDIAIFDQPVANILVRGLTRLFNCDGDPQPKEYCSNMEDLTEGKEYPAGVTIDGVKFSSLGTEALVARTEGTDRMLSFPAAGMRIDLPAPAAQVRLTLWGNPEVSLDLTAFSNAPAPRKWSDPMKTVPRTITVNDDGTTAIEIAGGISEAGVIELCWTPSEALRHG